MARVAKKYLFSSSLATFRATLSKDIASKLVNMQFPTAGEPPVVGPSPCKPMIPSHILRILPLVLLIIAL